MSGLGVGRQRGEFLVGEASVKLVMVVMMGDYLELVIWMQALQGGCRGRDSFAWVVWSQPSGLEVGFSCTEAVFFRGRVNSTCWGSVSMILDRMFATGWMKSRGNGLEYAVQYGGYLGWI